MIDKKIIFNITFHHQIDVLKYHLDNILNWGSANILEFVIVTAHSENLEKIKHFTKENYPDKKIDFIFTDPDLGYHMGTMKNVYGGIEYIKNNKNYDFIVNVEADNMFYDERKLYSIISDLIINKKEFLLIQEGHNRRDGNLNLQTTYPELTHLPRYLHITTLNIFTKNFIEEYFPFDVYDDIFDLGWMGQNGTPFEVYFALSMIRKHNLKSENEQIEFFDRIGLRLDYDYNKIIYQGWYYPDNMVPDKFIKWGIVNCHSTAGGRLNGTWEPVKEFINLHKPLITYE